MKKRMTALLVCLVMVLSMGLTGCGGGSDEDTDLSGEDYDSMVCVNIDETVSESVFKALAGSTQEATLTSDWGSDDDMGLTFEMEYDGNVFSFGIGNGTVEESDEAYNVENGSLAELEEGNTVTVTFNSSYCDYEKNDDGSLAYMLVDSLVID